MLFPTGTAYPDCDPDPVLERAEPTILCVFATGAAGASGGDSGGPWYVRGADGVDRQVGVTSFGATTGYPTRNSPAYLASVPEMLPWITSVSGGDGDGGAGGGGSLGSLFGSLAPGSSG